MAPLKRTGMTAFSSTRQKRHFLRAFRAYKATITLVPNAITAPPLPFVIRTQLSRLADELDCSMPLYEAVPVGADLTHVLDRWFYWLLTVELKRYKTSTPVAELYRRRLAGDEPTKEEWKKVANADAAYAANADAANAAYAANASRTRMRKALLNIVRATAPRASVATLRRRAA